MAFPTSITYTRNIHIYIKSQHIEEVLNLIEQECSIHGRFDFKRENDKLIFVERSKKRRGKKSDFFGYIDYATVEVDIYSHIITYDFYVIKATLSHVGIGVLIIFLAVIQKESFPLLHLILLVIFALNITLQVYLMKQFVAKITNEINWTFDRDEEDIFFDY